MGGMGLTRRRAASQEASSEAIEQAQELAHAGEQSSKQQVLEGLISRVQALVYGADPDLPSFQQAFHCLEAADIFMEQVQDDINTGLTDEQRIQLMHLLCAAWITVCRRLQAADALSDIVNWKYVLRRAVERIDVMAGDAPVSQALDILQAMVEDDVYDLPEDGQQGAGIAAQYDLASQTKLYLHALERTSLADEAVATGGEQRRGGRPAALNVQSDDTGLEEEDEDAASEYAAQVQQLGTHENGRLIALDDVASRPLLLRVCTRLPADHPLRKEAEQNVGAEVGTEGWQAAVEEAMAAAKAAGHILPPLSVTIPEPDPTPSGLMDSAGLGGLQSMPNLLLSGFGDEGEAAGAGAFSFGGEPTASVAIFSPVPRLSACDSRLALFGNKTGADGPLLNEDDVDTSQGLDADLEPALDMQPPAAEDKLGGSLTQRSMGVSYASLASTTMNSLPSELNLNMLPVSGGSMSGTGGNASAMASLAQLLGDDGGAGGADDVGLGGPARVEFSSVDASDALLGPSSGGMGVLDSRLGTSSPGVAAWATDLAPAGTSAANALPARSPLGEVGYEDQLGEGLGSGFDEAWLGGGDDGGQAMLGVSLGDVSSMGVTAVKRPLSSLPLPMREAKRVR